jgi:hypothetical protein
VGEVNLGVSVGIYQPGVYGRIEFGGLSQPAVVYAQPIMIAPRPVVIQLDPVYLYVPPAHQAHWAKYCSQYGACAQPVYFVQERWVRERYDEQQHRGHGNDKDKDHGKKPKQHKD